MGETGLAPPTTRATITGLVLAGGRALRMGGVDKGLQPFRGQPLVDHAIARLAPQVAEVLVSANRNAAAYAGRGVRVVADTAADFPGPLAGMLAGLRAAHTPWLAVVPCDAPLLPADLVERLALDLAGASAAVVERGFGADDRRLEPVCCLLSTSLGDDLERWLAEGNRKVEAWLVRHATRVPFDRADDADAFANFNTLAELEG
jgi:molybdopterin-guanine dinucleotide biosynthesis protein A